MAEIGEKITLDKQGGTGGTDAVYAVNNDATLPAILPPTRPGYIFGGYYTGTNGSGTQYYSAGGVPQKYFGTGITPLYAKWTQWLTVTASGDSTA